MVLFFLAGELYLQVAAVNTCQNGAQVLGLERILTAFWEFISKFDKIIHVLLVLLYVYRRYTVPPMTSF